MVSLSIKMTEQFLFKGSVFKSWKKRHFKAVGGKLHYYEVCKRSEYLS